MNLFAVNVDRLIHDDVNGVYNGDYIIAAVMNTNSGMSHGASRNRSDSGSSDQETAGHLGKPILHDTCFVLNVNKTSGDEDDDVESDDEKKYRSNVKEDNFYDTPTNVSSTRPTTLRSNSSSGGTFHVNGEIIGPLKVVLSKDIYEQILQTLDNLVYDDYEDRMMRGEIGSNLGGDGRAAAGADRRASSGSNDAPESIVGGAYDLSLGQSANDVVKVDFKLPVLQVEMKGNFGLEEVCCMLCCIAYGKTSL